MVLEWLQGRSLAEDLADRRKRGMQGRSVEEALALLEPAAEGLSIAHERRVAHRDIKPANFFILDDPKGPHLKVLDFGIAKIIRDGEGPGTRSPFASFTWLYAAPEQLDPRLGQSGLATDVYSFALLFTELLIDRSPSEGRDVVALLKAATDPTVRPTPRQRGANVPDAIEAACRRALAVDPKARFATIGELWAALSAARKSMLPAAADSQPTDPSARPSNVVSSGPTAPQPKGWQPMHSGAPPMPSGVPPMQSGQPYPHPSQGYPPAPQTSMQGPMPGAYAPGYLPQPSMHAAPMAPYSAAAMSPPRMMPPPGMPAYPSRRIVPPASSVPMVLAIIGLVLGLMFVATCAAVHAAC
jgi:serine/threonine-protein kinase